MFGTSYSADSVFAQSGTRSVFIISSNETRNCFPMTPQERTNQQFGGKSIVTAQSYTGPDLYFVQQQNLLMDSFDVTDIHTDATKLLNISSVCSKPTLQITGVNQVVKFQGKMAQNYSVVPATVTSSSTQCSTPATFKYNAKLFDGHANSQKDEGEIQLGNQTNYEKLEQCPWTILSLACYKKAIHFGAHKIHSTKLSAQLILNKNILQVKKEKEDIEGGKIQNFSLDLCRRLHHLSLFTSLLILFLSQ